MGGCIHAFLCCVVLVCVHVCSLCACVFVLCCMGEFGACVHLCELFVCFLMFTCAHAVNNRNSVTFILVMCRPLPIYISTTLDSIGLFCYIEKEGL